MREADFPSLKVLLLRGGIAPRHVQRTIAELQDHHTDLFSEAFATGCSIEDAEREASARLGSVDSLATEILARPELRSWAHRWPWVAYAGVPIAVLALAFVVLVLIVGSSGVVHVDRGTFSNRWGSPDSVWSLGGAIRMIYSLGLPLVVAAACCFVAGQRRAAVRWPVLGVIIASIIGGAIQFNVAWPNGPDVYGALSTRIAIPPFPGSAGTFLRVVTTSALTLGPYLWWRKREARPA